MPASHLHVVTGGPGSGKSTLIDALAAEGVTTSPEVGRRIVREQLASGGTALPWGDEAAFADLMIGGELAAHAAALARGGTVVLDRGVPDVVGFLHVSGLPVPPAIDAAARATRYNPRVFLAPFWAAIYAHDPERRQPAALAERTEAIMRDTYAGYGYTVVELPRASVAERVAFVRAALEECRMIRRRLVVTGRVQNVFFRDWFVAEATALGLDGWVRNRADGSVEAVVAGAPEMVEAMIARARRGSPASRVADVAVSDDAPTETLAGFEKRATR